MNKIMTGLFTVLLLTTFSCTAFAHGKTNQNYQPDTLLIPQSELVYLTTDKGLVVIHVTDIQSPMAAKQFKKLVKDGFYDGLGFYRVIDGFVAQGGQGESGEEKGVKTEKVPTLNAEFTQPLNKTPDFLVMQSPAFLAPETGYINGYAAGRDLKTNEAWLLHCPGIVAMARNNEPDTASSEIYIVIGQATRHLDRNMSTFGRVIEGMEIVQSFNRGTKADNGIIASLDKQTRILSARIGSDLQTESRSASTLMEPAPINFVIENSRSEKFKQRINGAKNKTHPFFVYPGNGNLDLCYYQPKVTIEKTK